MPASGGDGGSGAEVEMVTTGLATGVTEDTGCAAGGAPVPPDTPRRASSAWRRLGLGLELGLG